ncbi:MAG TPA: hypothetical protein V6D29_19645 [Leptolyngbyaceae cyanobacterium]
MGNGEPYHGWLVEIVEESSGYSFRCHHPKQELVVSDHQVYLTYEQALKVARLRADLESVRLSLVYFLHSKLQLLLLSPAERSALENSITHCVNATIHHAL